VEYAGGYSDMLAQRAGASAPAAMATGTPVVARGTAGAKPTPGGRGKMTFKDRHALETLPRQIELLGEEIAKLRRVLADADLYRRDPKRFARATDLLTAKEAELAEAEEAWLRLELLRETAEG
jgi:ATP-binding cassette subfamily F protein uup